MKTIQGIKKIEFGDFQTPIELAQKICFKLIELGVNPDLIIEPTCGVGNFIKASQKAFENKPYILGIEINSHYVLRNLESKFNHQRIEIYQGDFFEFDWSPYLNNNYKSLLVLGNFPWVTNSKQGSINSLNLPKKSNLKNYRGIESITGKSNFDISEWMLIKACSWFQNRQGWLAMICKLSVARKILNHLKSNRASLEYAATFGIDTKKYFDADVEACLLFLKFSSNSKSYFCDVFSSLKAQEFNRIGYYNNRLVQNLFDLDKSSKLFGKNSISWRSGIKHDCVKVMELRRVGDRLINGFKENVEIEEQYIFPLLKGSDVANGKIGKTERFLIVTQRKIGQETIDLQQKAPKLWDYLNQYQKLFADRKSKIYNNNPSFSIFGVGEYTFLPWKIAICSLYKKLEFQLIEEINSKPVVFDDTVYFLSFSQRDVAEKTLKLLNSKTAQDFLNSLIFWDEKRPIKVSILNSLDLERLAEEYRRHV